MDEPSVAPRGLTPGAASSAVTEPPLVAVSVVSHGDGARLEELLDSLARYESARHLQLIVTDNLGSDLTELDASRWHSLIMLRNDRRLGYGENHNRAFQRAQRGYFCVLNPDVVFQQSTFEPLIRLLAEKQADIVAPLIVDARSEVQDSFRLLPSPWSLLRRRLGARASDPGIPEGDLVRPDWIAGIFLLFRTETFSGLGGFDPRYRMYFEDVDLCTRARLRGFSIAVDTHVRLRHDAQRASGRPGRHLLWHTLSAVRFFASNVYRRARRENPHGYTRP
jgi:N-acetylglucosaminyl-diphospho-decaprenol L-rhamnosyltransferase